MPVRARGLQSPAIPPLIDRTGEAELSDCSPHCGGELVGTKIERRYWTEAPQPKGESIKFRIHVCVCKGCDQGV